MLETYVRKWNIQNYDAEENYFNGGSKRKCVLRNERTAAFCSYGAQFSRILEEAKEKPRGTLPHRSQNTPSTVLGSQAPCDLPHFFWTFFFLSSTHFLFRYRSLWWPCDASTWKFLLQFISEYGEPMSGEMWRSGRCATAAMVWRTRVDADLLIHIPLHASCWVFGEGNASAFPCIHRLLSQVHVFSSVTKIPSLGRAQGRVQDPFHL